MYWAKETGRPRIDKFIVESGRLIAAIMNGWQGAVEQIEGDCSLRRTYGDAVPVGRARLRSATKRDDGQVASATDERHHEFWRPRSRCCSLNRSLR